MSAAPENTPRRLEIFRAADAPSFNEIDVMSVEGVTPELGDTFARLIDAGFHEGETVKLLFSAPGFSLTYAWFKSRFPLPRHSHDADCLYYVVGGSLTLGSEVLGKGDGFFVPADGAYAYTPGPDGVEVLEFRTAERFNIRFLVGNPAFWSKALATIEAERGAWAVQHPPSERAAEPA